MADVVVIAGKGHEDYQEIMDRKAFVEMVAGQVRTRTLSLGD